MMTARPVALAILLVLACVQSALAQPLNPAAITVRIFPAAGFDISAAPESDREHPIVGDVTAIDDVVLIVRSRTTGRLIHVPLAAVDRIERLKRHDPVLDSMKLLAATGGAWIGSALAGRRFFGTASTGAKLGAIAVAQAGAWAAYTAVLHANQRERWEPVDLHGLRAALAAPGRGSFH